MATKRRRFTAEFKGRVAMEELCGGPHDPGDRGQAPGASEPGFGLEVASPGWPGVDVPHRRAPALPVLRQPPRWCAIWRAREWRSVGTACGG